VSETGGYPTPLAELTGRRRAALPGETEGDPASLLHPAPNGTLRTWPVDRRVGSPRNNGAEQIKPIEIAV
jgi:putative SOS response-associated peptidase YedK